MLVGQVPAATHAAHPRPGSSRRVPDGVRTSRQGQPAERVASGRLVLIVYFVVMLSSKSNTLVARSTLLHPAAVVALCQVNPVTDYGVRAHVASFFHRMIVLVLIPVNSARERTDAPCACAASTIFRR